CSRTACLNQEIPKPTQYWWCGRLTPQELIGYFFIWKSLTLNSDRPGLQNYHQIEDTCTEIYLK
ncbi:hypothetical protein, partial [uncultured Nostoc sp.]|uniref:hypothetical protein n=1 Tax=uncultured Nostoc sp. TaxID=340711 RepID=UPI0035CB81DB